ncbi:MAG: DUF4258 domain-containing protein [Bacteroidia bacterium]|nr:DUF4258 domain-containing protein [Bacteroidia bacterium]
MKRTMAAWMLAALFAAACGSGGPGQQVESMHNIPSNESLTNGKIRYSYVAACQMRCNRISTKKIRQILSSAKIKTTERWQGAKPCPLYMLTHEPAEGKKISVTIADCDSVTMILRVVGPNDAKCGGCKTAFKRKTAEADSLKSSKK